MAIDKALPNGQTVYEPSAQDALPPYPNAADAIVTDADDGGLDLDFDPEDDAAVEAGEFYDNLAEYLDEGYLRTVGSDLVGKYDNDKLSRKEWEDTYTKGIKLLGLSVEEKTEPWDGACSIKHPLLSEAIVRFQSQSIGEIFPAVGPARAKILGQETPDLIKQATRVKDMMNYVLTQEMEEYRDEKDTGLFYLAYGGSVFFKIYWSESLGRPTSEMVPAEDLVVPYGAKTLQSAERFTHRMRKSKNEIRKLQVSGFYSDIDLGAPRETIDEIAQGVDESTGREKPSASEEMPVLLEMHVNLDIEGFEDEADGAPTGIELPYIVTIDYSSRKILSIYRNYLEEDEKKKKRRHFSHFKYIPGMGFYGLGLIHLIGGIVEGSTAILQQLVDAGTIANLPGGFKTKNMRVQGDGTPIGPGEFRDVDIVGARLQDCILPLPYKEPSTVLATLLGSIVEEGRRFASLTDISISSMNSEAPVGTTLALLERNLKVMTAIQARIHKAMGDEMKIISDMVNEHYEEYPYDVGDEQASLQEDFSGKIDIIPVSDPNASTMAQKIMRHQAVATLDQQAPGVMRRGPVYRGFLNALEIPNADEIIPLEEDIAAMDPVTENQHMLNGDPVRAFMYQDHQAHIQVHMLGMQDPKIQAVLQNSPTAQASIGANMAHITEHIAYEYRAQIEQHLGVSLPPEEEPLPPEIEVELSRLIAQAASKLFEANKAEEARAEADEQEKDPIFQMRKREMEVKELDAASRAQERVEKMQLEIAKLAERWETAHDVIEKDRDVASARVKVDVLGHALEAASRAKSLTVEERIKLADLVIEQVKQDGENIRAQLKAKSDGNKVDADFFSKIIMKSTESGGNNHRGD